MRGSCHNMLSDVIKLMTTKELNGLTGDNGENFVVFIRNLNNPLASGWKWFTNENEARQFMTIVSVS
jgi:hypothetical protein